MRYAYALVPFGAGVWLAHYGFHFLTGCLDVRAGDAERGDRRGGRALSWRAELAMARHAPGCGLSAADRRRAARRAWLARARRTAFPSAIIPGAAGARRGALEPSLIVGLARAGAVDSGAADGDERNGTRRMTRHVPSFTRCCRGRWSSSRDRGRARAQRPAVSRSSRTGRRRLPTSRSGPIRIRPTTDRRRGQFWVVLEPAGRASIDSRPAPRPA